jgi:hypothetical protein
MCHTTGGAALGQVFLWALSSPMFLIGIIHTHHMIVFIFSSLFE